MDNEKKYILDLIDGAHARTVRRLIAVIAALVLCWGLTIAGFLTSHDAK